jgi:hypothetical protein
MMEITESLKQELRLRLYMLKESRGDLPLETEVFKKFLEELKQERIKITPKIKNFLVNEYKRIEVEYMKQGGKMPVIEKEQDKPAAANPDDVVETEEYEKVEESDDGENEE